MPSNKHFSPRDTHTIVLQSRLKTAAKIPENSSKQVYFETLTGYSPKPPPTQQRVDRPPKEERTQFVRQTQIESSVRGNDLLVRFGIDSGPGRMVTRILTMLLLFQPVYVAMGMEVEEQAPVVPVSEDMSEEQEKSTTEELSDKKPDATADELPQNDTESIEETESLSDSVSEDITQTPSTQEESETTDVVETERRQTQEAGQSDTASNSEKSDSDNGANFDEEQVTENNGEEDNEVPETEPEEITEETTGEATEETDEENSATENVGDDSTASDTETEEYLEGDEPTENDEGSTDEESNESDEGETSSGGGGSNDSNLEGEDSSGNDSSDETTGDTDPTEDGEESQDGTSATSTATTTKQSENSEATQTEATSTPKTDETQTAIAQNLTNKYVFGEGDCTVVSDGEFYCVAEGPLRQQMTGDPRVYAQKDRAGDKEIYFFDGIEVKAITNNSYDDFAPMYDEETRRIVWQSMISDRLQIMMHEIPTNITRQITTSSQNSSNPSISGDTVVWQEWVGTNWEIMMTDIDTKGGEFEVEQLTDNAVHDMFPSAYNGLVTWQSERGSSWEVIVYDMHTGKQHALEKDEDTKYENPRFVLLFDSKHDNGDVETVGYDLDTGEMMELGTKPGQIPVEPVTPKDETPEAIYREATSSPQIKVEGDDDDDAGNEGDDGTVVL